MARYLFIPSCEVQPINSLTHTTTLRRLQHGLQMWRRGDYDKIVVMGGIYLPPEVQTRPSGELMKEWLVQQGVDAASIIDENGSRDTYENIALALHGISDDRRPNITVVSHWQHTLRFLVTFWLAHRIRVGIEPMFYWVDAKTFVLEWVILLIHLFDRYGKGKIVSKNRAARTFPRPQPQVQ